MARRISLKRRIGTVLCLAMLALTLAIPAGAVDARRVVCKAYDQAEF